MTFSSDYGFCSKASHGQYCTYGPETTWPSPPTPNSKSFFSKAKGLNPPPPFKFLAKKFLKIPIIQGVQILLNLIFPTFWGFVLLLSYFLGYVLLILLLGFFLLLSYFSSFFPTFPTFWDLILILILILNTLPIYILFSYFLVFFLTFLVADMKGKPYLP